MLSEEQKQLVIAYKQCFATEQGQKVLADLSGVCYEKKNTFVCNSARGDGVMNASYQNMLNGKRSVFIYIRQQIETDLDKPEPPKPKDDNYVTFEGN